MAEREGFSDLHTKAHKPPIELAFILAIATKLCYKTAMKHLILRGSTWYARLGIPADARAKLGDKREFVQSLKTSDKKKAQILAGPLIAEWRNAIEIARGKPSAIESIALQLRQEAAHAKDADPVTGMSGIQYAAEGVAESLSTTEQNAFYDIYTGRVGTPVDRFAKEFIKHSYANTKTMGDAARAIAILKQHCPSLERVDRHGINKWLSTETRSKSSVEKTISFLAVYWRYLQDQELVSPDFTPFSKLKLPKTLKQTKAREPFTDEDVSSILKAIEQNGDLQLLDLSRLAMYTGARISELAALKVENIINEEEVRCFAITDSKTKAGIRTVPIHKKLQTIVKRLVSESVDGFLISGVNSKGGTDRRADVLGKRFGRIVRHKVRLPSSKVFHCFRNTAISKLEQAGVTENIAADIVGHEKDTMTYGLYSGGTSQHQRKMAINKISYEFESNDNAST